jgi:serine/threonine protein kinase
MTAPQETPHPDIESLRAYADGAVDEAVATAIRLHLESCPQCRRQFNQFGSDSYLSRLGAQEVRPSLIRLDLDASEGLFLPENRPPSPVSPGAGNRNSVIPELANHPDYEIIRELGRGGMGVVYLARNKLMGRLEVLKVVGGHLARRPGVLERFVTEIRNAARLHHPNIVTAYSALRAGEFLVFAMEYIEGLDLAKLVAAKGALPIANACYYVHEAAMGLQHAHEHNIVHRDIKPTNLMLAGQGNRALIKILDFGLAKIQSEGPSDTGLTHEGQMLGTPHFIAPEQINDARRADIRADIYGLGCTLYNLLTGAPPFHGSSLYDILQAHQSRAAPALNIVRPEVPIELGAIVAKMMAKDPERRFQEPRDVARALAPFFKGASAAHGSRPVDAPISAPSHAAPGLTPALGSMATHGAPFDGGPSTLHDLPAKPQPGPPRTQPVVGVEKNKSAPDDRPIIALRPRRAWHWVAATAAAVAVGTMGAAWFLLPGPMGLIEIVNLPKETPVLIDGREVDITWPAGGKPPYVAAPSGTHTIALKKDGAVVFTEQVTVGANETAELTVASTLPGSDDDSSAEGTGAAPPAEIAANIPTTPDRSPSEKPIVPANALAKPGESTLVAFYNFDDGTARDASGHGHHGTMSPNPPQPTSEGYEAGALLFDPRRENFVTIPVDIDPAAMPQITMGGWANSRAEGGDQTLLSRDNGGYDRTLVIRHSDNGSPFEWTAFTGSGLLWSLPVQFQKWTFVAMRHDQATGELILDVDGNRTEAKAHFDVGAQSTMIGKNPYFNAYFNGSIDNVFIFRSVLDDATIADIRARGRAAILGPIAPPRPHPAANARAKVANSAPSVATPTKGSRAAAPSGTSLKARARGPLSLTRLRFRDEFSGPKSVSTKNSKGQTVPAHGRSDGAYFVDAPNGSFYGWNIHEIRAPGTCEVVARVANDHKSKSGSLMVIVSSKVSPRGFVVEISARGRLVVTPSPWPRAAAFRNTDPKLGPITHPSIHGAGRFNTITLKMAKRELLVFVNGVQVSAPIQFDYDIVPAELQFGADGPGDKRASFDRYEIREFVEP